MIIQKKGETTRWHRSTVPSLSFGGNTFYVPDHTTQDRWKHLNCEQLENISF